MSVKGDRNHEGITEKELDRRELAERCKQKARDSLPESSSKLVKREI